MPALLVFFKKVIITNTELYNKFKASFLRKLNDTSAHFILNFILY